MPSSASWPSWKRTEPKHLRTKINCMRRQVQSHGQSLRRSASQHALRSNEILGTRFELTLAELRLTPAVGLI